MMIGSSNFPPTKGVRWFNVFILTFTPLLALYGLIMSSIQLKTMLFSGIYYLFTMLGETFPTLKHPLLTIVKGSQQV